jgi:hypothetical protein
MEATLASLLDDLRSIGWDPGAEQPSLAFGRRPSDAMIDRWARAAALADPEPREVAIWAIREAAHAAGIVPASIQDLYIACADGKWSGRTVPAMNLRGWTYQTCRAAFRAARSLDAHLLIFEQAIGEWLYADQPPAEYTAGVLAAALREGHTGPVFLQADHDQVNAAAFRKDRAGEIQRLERIMREQIAAGYFNIDIDASTLVDLSLAGEIEQQRLNAEVTAHFTRFVRSLEPEGVTISLGAEIGEVGHHNTTPAELRAFMATYPEALRKLGANVAGVSKISVNSGTYHGGKMMPDGRLAPVVVDYGTLTAISDICRREFRMAGAVQHGASTLPARQLARFPGSGAIEIHLALGFNNLIFDHPALPAEIKAAIRDYTSANHAKERVPGENDAQFLYNTRKKSWKAMKRPFWDLPAPAREAIMNSLEAMFADMFRHMNVAATRALVAEHTRARKVPPSAPPALAKVAR